MIFEEMLKISEDIIRELLEIFGEIFEDFWILFGALIRAVRVDRAVRVVLTIRAVRAQALYKVSGEHDFSHS